MYPKQQHAFYKKTLTQTNEYKNKVSLQGPTLTVCHKLKSMSYSILYSENHRFFFGRGRGSSVFQKLFSAPT